MWNSLWQHAPYCPASSEQSIFLTKSTPIRNVKVNFLPPQSYAAPTQYAPVLARHTVHTVVPSIICYMDRQKSPYLLKTSEQTSPVEWCLAVQKADYESKVVLFQRRFLSSPLKICKPSYFWNCSVTCPKYGVMLAEKRCLYIGGKKGQITKRQNTTKTTKTQK